MQIRLSDTGGKRRTVNCGGGRKIQSRTRQVESQGGGRSQCRVLFGEPKRLWKPVGSGGTEEVRGGTYSLRRSRQNSEKGSATHRKLTAPSASLTVCLRAQKGRGHKLEREKPHSRCQLSAPVGGTISRRREKKQRSRRKEIGDSLLRDK